MRAAAGGGSARARAMQYAVRDSSCAARCTTSRPRGHGVYHTLRTCAPRPLGFRKARSLVVVCATGGGIAGRFDDAWRKLKGVDKLSEENIKEPVKQVRRALLEADVNLPVVRNFCKRVESKALGASVLGGLDPESQFVKVVRDELVNLMGSSDDSDKKLNDSKMQIILMLGLQGVGKTTACAKLASFLKRDKKVCLIACDTYRPAAAEQLMKLGNKIDTVVFSAADLGTEDAGVGGVRGNGKADPVAIAKRGIAFARKNGYESVVVDTAGRLQVDEDMMEEIVNIKDATVPSDVLLVCDAMTGQEAASLAKVFDDRVGITGALLSKMDGDTRGGAALTMKAITGKPVKFISMGEGMGDLELFRPDRMASRILGMGDVLTLVEKAEEAFKDEEVKQLQSKMMEAKFDFDDFVKQLDMMNRMGALGQTMRLIPGMNKITDKQMMEAERSMKNMREMIEAMTDEERADPDMVAESEDIRKRISEESGKDMEAVNAMVDQFMALRQQMRQFSSFMQAKEDLAKIEGLPTELQNQAQVGRKISKGKVLRKRKDLAPAAKKGFGK